MPDPEHGGYELQHRGQVYAGDHVLLAEVAHLRFAHGEVFAQWQAACAGDLAQQIPRADDRARLLDLVIRGISDLGDERKRELDRMDGGAIRRLAMRNATRFLWALLDAGILPRPNQP